MATTTTILIGRIADGLASTPNTVTDEHWTSSLDVWVALAHQNLEPSGVLVRSTDNLTTYTLGTDYQMNYAQGLIKALSGGTMADATAYHISYTYPDGGLADKVNAITGPKQAAGKWFKVATTKISPERAVAVIVTEN